jgi:predicted DNA-binding transcriptional regulator AlpA
MYKFNHIRVGDVAKIYNVSVPTIWRWVKEDPNFPQPVKIFGSTRWLNTEVEEYMVALHTKK